MNARLVAGAAAVTVLLVVASACSSRPTPGSNPGGAELSALVAQDTDTQDIEPTGAETPDAGGQGTEATGPAAYLIDPCSALTKADVQPFFTAEIVTALPALLQSATEKSCEWATTNKASSLIVDYLVGDGAQTKVTINQQPGGGAVPVPGVGDGANHPAGDASLLFSYKGSGSGTAVCTVTTTGTQFALVPQDPAQRTDAQATTIDQQYGTLCNRLYGAGDTTPTVPGGSVAAAPALPSLTASVPADSGQTLPGTGIPLPAGVDCSGSHTATDSLNGLSCEQPIDDAQAVYAFYLQALPAHGYTVNSQTFYPATADGPAHASIMFTGDQDGLCFVSIVAGKLTVSKQEN